MYCSICGSLYDKDYNDDIKLCDSCLKIIDDNQKKIVKKLDNKFKELINIHG